MDAAAEYNNYASDITRTIPISGKFNEFQKKIYEIESNFGKKDFFHTTSRDEIKRLQAEMGRLNEKLSGYLKEWESSSQDLENAKEKFDL